MKQKLLFRENIVFLHLYIRLSNLHYYFYGKENHHEGKRRNAKP